MRKVLRAAFKAWCLVVILAIVFTGVIGLLSVLEEQIGESLVAVAVLTGLFIALTHTFYRLEP